MCADAGGALKPPGARGAGDQACCVCSAGGRHGVLVLAVGLRGGLCASDSKQSRVSLLLYGSGGNGNHLAMQCE